MRTTPRPATYKPSAPLAPSCASLPKKLTREELHDRSAKGLCWHCNELWSRNHHSRKGKLSMIEPIEEYEEDDLEPEEENMKEDPQLVDCMTHTSRDKLFLKCHIQLNQLWLLMQHSQISSYFHYLSQERTMLFEVFPIDDRKKIRSLQQ
ncbi:hypothetical protein BHE74_00040964 [Ensete ventricosum]|nr:hypothetical protein GW17_00008540 [Ensete ventricosum]RWW52598.1 hypothetical protein BHE74_00040964 [Ensete ventricosum]RZR96802.1 hypothetical protein BHM03_00025866 [Ensete ventricosum]